jgi:hypothetical protein
MSVTALHLPESGFRSQILVPHLPVDLFVRRAINLGVGIHEEIQPLSLLGRAQPNVAPHRKRDPVLVVRSEKVITALGMLLRF